MSSCEKSKCCAGRERPSWRRYVKSAYLNRSTIDGERNIGGMTTSDAKKYRELEKENARLKKLVVDLSLDNAILKDIAEGNL